MTKETIQTLLLSKQGQAIRDIIKDMSAKDRAEVKGVAIAQAVQKKKYKKVNGVWK
jgi:hypothetical protein